MTARLVTECGLCGSENLEMVFGLGSSPPTCVMQPVGARQASEDHHPLDLLLCHDCSLVQLSVVVDPEVVFPADYPYSSGNSRALHANFEDLAHQANTWFHGLGPNDLVVDIGANDGTLLSKFGKGKRLGVEPTNQIAKWRDGGGLGYQAAFTEEVAAEIVDRVGPAKVVTACNVLAHVEDIHDVMRGIKLLLADDGILIAENHDLEAVVRGGQWDTVYHEHLRFWDARTFHRLLVDHGLWAEDWQDIPTHGGSFRVIASKKSGDILDPGPYEYDWDAFRARTQRSRWSLRAAVSANRNGGKRIGGIGATARATTIINACGFDADDIEAVYELSGSDKIGRYIPGTSIPVVDEAVLHEQHAPGTCIVFAWYMDHVIPNIRKGYRGVLIKPLPDFEYLRTNGRAGGPVGAWMHA